MFCFVLFWYSALWRCHCVVFWLTLFLMRHHPSFFLVLILLGALWYIMYPFFSSCLEDFGYQQFEYEVPICFFLLIFIYLFGCMGSYLQQVSSLVVACEFLVVTGMWDLVPWPGIEPEPPALGAQSLIHCATREIPEVPICVLLCMYLVLGLLNILGLWTDVFH